MGRKLTESRSVIRHVEWTRDWLGKEDEQVTNECTGTAWKHGVRTGEEQTIMRSQLHRKKKVNKRNRNIFEYEHSEAARSL